MIVGEWMRRLGYLLRRGTLDEELRREMEAHRAMLKDPAAFGNTLRLRDEARDAWGWTWLDDFAQDTRLALRALGRNPEFALTAVVTLALGIGANVGMFGLVDAVLLRSVYERPDEVVAVYAHSTGPAGEPRGVSYQRYRDLRDAAVDVFASLTAYSTASAGLDRGDGPRRTLASAVTANYFETLGRPLALGRPFTVEEERPGADVRVAVIGHALWKRDGADPRILGRSILVNGATFTVVGVAAEGFAGVSIPGPEVWLPIGASATLRTRTAPTAGARDARDADEFDVVGRLRDGVTVDTATAALTTAARRFDRASSASDAADTLEVAPPPRLAFMPGPTSGTVTATLSLLLMLMPAVVLLVACLNLVDLLLARGQARGQEMAIRASLGGGRGRLARQLLSEGLLLSVAGGAVGLVLSFWATNALLAAMRPILPVAVSLPAPTLDWRALAGTVTCSVAATLLSGAWPAWVLTNRAATTDLSGHARAQGRSRWGGGRIGNALVIGQVALSVLLLASGGLFLMSALSAATADPGFRLEGGLLAEVDPGLAGYDEARGRQAHLALVDRLRAVPGIASVTIGSRVPFMAVGDSREVVPAGAGADARAKAVDAVFTVVGRDYARTLGLPLLGGRDFSAAEMLSGSPARVAIVDDALAERLWPGEAAVGRLVQFLDAEGPQAAQPLRVVGLIPAVKHSLGNPRPFPHVYVPLGQHYESAMTLQVRIADETGEQALLPVVARAIRDVDARVPVLRVETWRTHLDGSLDVWLYRAGARVFAAFGAIALLLAVVGVYGVKSYVVSRRTREFGIRIATGAHPRVLLWQLLREGSRTTLIGIAIGLLLAVAAGRLLQGLLYGVDAIEPVVLVAAPLILLVSSLMASYLPALRATRVDPVEALRSE